MWEPQRNRHSIWRTLKNKQTVSALVIEIWPMPRPIAHHIFLFCCWDQSPGEWHIFFFTSNMFHQAAISQPAPWQQTSGAAPGWRLWSIGRAGMNMMNPERIHGSMGSAKLAGMNPYLPGISDSIFPWEYLSWILLPLRISRWPLHPMANLSGIS